MMQNLSKISGIWVFSAFLDPSPPHLFFCMSIWFDCPYFIPDHFSIPSIKGLFKISSPKTISQQGLATVFFYRRAAEQTCTDRKSFFFSHFLLGDVSKDTHIRRERQPGSESRSLPVSGMCDIVVKDPKEADKSTASWMLGPEGRNKIRILPAAYGLLTAEETD